MKNETTAVDKDKLIAVFKRNIAMHRNGPVLSTDIFSDHEKSCHQSFITGLERGLEIVELTEPTDSTSQIAALRSALESIRDLPNGKSHTRAIGIAIKALAGQGIDRI